MHEGVAQRLLDMLLESAGSADACSCYKWLIHRHRHAAGKDTSLTCRASLLEPAVTLEASMARNPLACISWFTH